MVLNKGYNPLFSLVFNLKLVYVYLALPQLSKIPEEFYSHRNRSCNDKRNNQTSTNHIRFKSTFLSVKLIIPNTKTLPNNLNI